jgi:hypothetical protein
MMSTLLKTGTIGLASLVASGLIAWQAPTALASHGSDDGPGDDRGHHHSKAVKRDDDAVALVTTVDDDDDDDTGFGQAKHTNTNTSTGTRTRTRTRGGTNTGTRTRGGVTDHSRGGKVRDLTGDGRGSGNVDHSRHHTNDRSRHDTRG